MPVNNLSRRELITKSATLSVAAFGLVAGLSPKASAATIGATTAQDIDILNVILGTEHEGIGAYQLCLDRKLLQGDTAKFARLFQDHHKKHRDILIEKVGQLGGTAATNKASDEYANDLDFVNLKNETAVLGLLLKLEVGAANAYIGMLPSTNDHELIKTASRIAADEVLHWATISSLLKHPLPTEALSFGA